MAVLSDLFCDNKECGFIKEDEMVDTSKDDYGVCEKCKKGKMRRMVGNKMTFELKYDNRTNICDWNGNTTKLWDGVKQAQAEGKNVNVPEKFRNKWY